MSPRSLKLTIHTDRKHGHPGMGRAAPESLSGAQAVDEGLGCPLCRSEPLGGAWPAALQRGGHILCPPGPAVTEGLRLGASCGPLAERAEILRRRLRLHTGKWPPAPALASQVSWKRPKMQACSPPVPAVWETAGKQRNYITCLVPPGFQWCPCLLEGSTLYSSFCSAPNIPHSHQNVLDHVPRLPQNHANWRVLGHVSSSIRILMPPIPGRF